MAEQNPNFSEERELVNPYTDIPQALLPPVDPTQGGKFLSTLREVNFGDSGDKVFRTDEQGLWLGNALFASAPFRVGMDGKFRIQNENGLLEFDPVTGDFVISASQISLNQRFEAGMDVVQGDITAIESDGKMWRPRITAEPSVAAEDENFAASLGFNNGNTRIVGYRDNPNSGLSCTLISAVEETTSTRIFASIIALEPFAMAAITEDDFVGTEPYCEGVTDDSAIVAYSDGGDVKARMITNLSGTFALETAATIGSTATAGRVARYSDTEVLCVYRDTASEDLKIKPITIAGGDTLTAGSVTNLLTGTLNTIYDFRRVGSTNSYILTYQDSVGNQYMMCVQYDGATFTIGTPITIIATTLGVEMFFDVLSDTKIVVSYKFTNISSVAIVTLSGTTLVLGTPVIVNTDGDASASSRRSSVCRLGNDSFVTTVMTSESAGTGNMLTALYRVEGTVPTLIGSTYVPEDINTGGTSSMFHTMIKISPKTFAYVYQNVALDYHITAYSPPTTLDQVIGVVADTTLESAIGGAVLQGFSDDLTDLTVAKVYYTDIDGALIGREQGGLDRFGIALSVSGFKVE